MAGIAVANAYVSNGDGTFSPALETTKMQGVASVDNAGSTTICFHVADKSITYMESEYSNKKLLTQSLLMSTAVPMVEESSLNYYPVLRQGAGLADVGDAVAANSYILMNEAATSSAADGKVKAELLDDPERTGDYQFGFTLNNLRDEAQQYVLSCALFTQGLFTEENVTYLDTETVDLLANITWTVDGKALTPDLDPSQYDVTGDKLVSGEDVQAILNYVLGKREIIGENADPNGDGEITSYDAYLLLQKLGTGTVTLPAGGKLEITVQLQLTDQQKAQLDESYKNGAYVEGFLFAQQLPTAEGLGGTCHSIPVLGFYGNWSDPSMYDHGTFIGRLYGDTTMPYAGYDVTNSLNLQYAGRSGAYHMATAMTQKSSFYAMLLRVDPETGKGELVN